MRRDTLSADHSSLSVVRSMKRKPSPDLAMVQCPKRQLKCSAAAAPSSPLIGILRQYGLLEAVVSNIQADDLLALALTSRGLHEAITLRPASLENLLGRLSCSGKGIEIRKRCHKKSEYFYTFKCSEYVQCGSETNGRVVEIRPCVSCKVATCDECRIHVVYQSIHEASSLPDDSAELPNFSGFVLLQPFEQAILSPHHLPSEDLEDVPRWKDPSLGEGGPYHDQGFLDVPLYMDDAAPPECIEEVLDIDLGQRSLMSISEDSRRYPFPSPVLSSLCSVTDERKIFLCEMCFRCDAPKGPEAMRPHDQPIPPLPWLARPASTTAIKACHCTLRGRYLERWLCLRCYQIEESRISASTSLMSKDCTGLCRCGCIACHILCLWCWGEVTERRDDDMLDSRTDGIRSSPQIRRV